MMRETLLHIEEQYDPSIKETCYTILTTLKGVIIICNEKEFDELLLCGLFALKVKFVNMNSTFAQDSIVCRDTKIQSEKWYEESTLKARP